ncbi:hypothetical protein [Bordetella genomosp. 13]|uniref:hypothetical protein n=1 Tax=Bordetella genomosp. 13 TaxID=463040 RepID=UPI00119FE7AF|nr:hypothetical protein [Bordetella genomosp. 13]
MTPTLFHDALDERRLMRPAFLQSHAYAARVFPDVLDRDAFDALAVMAGTAGEAILVHHAEFGKSPETIRAADPDDAWNAFFQISHGDAILEFATGALYAWLPAGERFHAVFGQPQIIDRLGDASKLADAFSEFVEDSGLTEQGRRFLREAYARYTV